MNVARTLNQLDSFCPGRVCWAYTLKEFFQEHIKNLGVAAFEDEMVCCNIYICTILARHDRSLDGHPQLVGSIVYGFRYTAMV